MIRSPVEKLAQALAKGVPATAALLLSALSRDAVGAVWAWRPPVMLENFFSGPLGC